jgi:dTDP-4-amino-4,6-dideoxy-D-galactose acyltransferase
MKKIELQSLEWDSNFFGKKIGLVDLREQLMDLQQLTSILDRASRENYAIIYCFCDGDVFIENAFLEGRGGQLVDRKVIFETNDFSIKMRTTFVEEYLTSQLCPELEQLALISGKYSRFRIEPYFSEGDYSMLYIEWLKKSLNNELSDGVFVAKEDGKIVGFVTLSLESQRAKIGLIAVDGLNQGRGYGSQLLDVAKHFCLEKNVKTLEVATQLSNTAACAFYEKNGFISKSLSNIYHFIL